MAEEVIKLFSSDINVQLDGDFIVTESITVNVEGQQIRRGIFRDLPRYKNYLGHDIPVRYNILSVKRNGNQEPYEIERDGNAYRLLIGNPDRLLNHADHTYEIKFEIKDEIRRDNSFDEVYWNVTGNYWRFPIERAHARITMPEGATLQSYQAWTGRMGSTANDAAFTQRGNANEFTTRQALSSGEGMTISLKFDKGIMLPEPESTRRYIWWLKNGALILLSLSFLAIAGYYYLTWNRVGRDPIKGAVFPIYDPPKDYSPAAASYIWHRGISGHKALTATLVSLSNKKWLKIETDKKKTILTPTDRDIIDEEDENIFELTRETFAGLLRGDKKTLKELGLDDPDDENLEFDVMAPEESERQNLNRDEGHLFHSLFPPSRRQSITLKKKVNTHFNLKYSAFQRRLAKDYGRPYHRFNVGYMVGGVLLSILATVITMSQLSKLSPSWIWGLLAALAALNILFFFLMPAPTRKGQNVRTELEGFRLYMKTAEKHRLDSVEIGRDELPPMSVKRYEQLLPYAIALDVEKPWSRYFEKVMPVEAKQYDPSWSVGTHHGSISHMTKSLTSNISSGVSSAAPQSSGSSSSGGGGFSGGGGGGGGGGGW